MVPTGRPTDRRSGTRRLVCGVEQRSGQWNTSSSDIPRCGLAQLFSIFKIRQKQVDALLVTLTCVVQSGENTGTHYTFRGKLCVDQSNSLHVSTSMESPMSFV